MRTPVRSTRSSATTGPASRRPSRSSPASIVPTKERCWSWGRCWRSGARWPTRWTTGSPWSTRTSRSVECLDIAHNMALGNLPRKFGVVLDRRRMEREASVALRELKVRVGNVRTPVGLLSGGQRQVVAIARAIRMDQPIVLLDEPTAALGVQESAHVAEMIGELRERRQGRHLRQPRPRVRVQARRPHHGAPPRQDGRDARRSPRSVGITSSA